MQQAAQSLQQLAQQLSQQPPNQPSKPQFTPKPSEFGMQPGGGKPDLSQIDPEMKKYEGKRWGELPGDLQARITKELTAKYGPDYALMIKRYYEQLADTPRK
jgi:hypothetical protein